LVLSKPYQLAAHLHLATALDIHHTPKNNQKLQKCLNRTILRIRNFFHVLPQEISKFLILHTFRNLGHFTLCDIEIIFHFVVLCFLVLDLKFKSFPKVNIL